MFGLPYAMEPAFPDVQVEWTDAGQEFVLAWPLAFPFVMNTRENGAGSLVVTPFVEYQYAYTSTEHRGLAGAQTVWLPLQSEFDWDSHPMVFGMGPRIEAAGVFGTDGRGVMGGAGWTLATFNAPMRGSYVSFSVMYRYTRAGSEDRHTATIDVQSTMLSDIIFGRL